MDKKWNIQDYLKTEEDIINYLQAAVEENDFEYLKIAVADVVIALKRIKNVKPV